jgi:phosphopantothenoylcysteine synthetase/decarboxylase
LASRAGDIVTALEDAGWRVQLVATPSAGAWLDEATIGGRPGQSEHRRPEEAKRGDQAAAVVVAPITFNTVGKLAAGIADTYAHGVLCEALGEGLPIVAVPMVNNRLWGHPAWGRHLGDLGAAGVRMVDVQTGEPHLKPVQSGTGPDVVARFDPDWIVAALAAAVADKS